MNQKILNNPQLQDLHSQIEGLKHRVTEAISRDIGICYFIKADNLQNAQELLNQIKSLGVSVVKPHEDFIPDEEDLKNFTPVDLRLNVEYTTNLLQQIRELQDQVHQIITKEFSEKSS